MTARQHILVSTEDPVLAKKIRFLLARDDCEVEILAAPKKLEHRLEAGGVSLLIASGTTGGEHTAHVLARLEAAQPVPPTILVGPQPTATPSYARVVEDPSDTQAIYRLASEALEREGSMLESAGLRADSGEGNVFSRRTQRTSKEHLETLSGEDELNMDDLDGLDFPSEKDLVSQFDKHMAGADPVGTISDDEEDEEDITVFDVASYHAATPSPSKRKKHAIGLSGNLGPKALAKALYQCWTMEARGALILSEPHETLAVYFEGGSPVHVESNIRGDKLGRNLVDRQVIDEARYAEAAKVAIERGSSIGQSIVELGFLTKEALGRELGEDAFDRLVKRFAARSGHFELQVDRPVPHEDRPYRIPIGRVLAEGLRKFGPDEGLVDIVGDIEKSYFRLRSSVEELSRRFPLSDRDREFLAYSGRAYNVSDAARLAGLENRGARVLLAILLTCEEVDPFTPGVAEFEARIQDEQRRQEEIEKRVSNIPGPSVLAGVPGQHTGPVASPFAALAEEARRSAPPPPLMRGPDLFQQSSEPPPLDILGASPTQAEPPSFLGGVLPQLTPSAPLPSPFVPPPPVSAPPAPAIFSKPPLVPPPPAPPAPVAPPIAPPAVAPPAPPPAPPPVSGRPHGTVEMKASIPPMPEPPSNAPGRIPRPVQFAPPAPRNGDGSLLDTPERGKSREHFQKGVGLLGQGAFDEAEESFRDAINLCADEHVYLIGLGRALYYNPSYTASGKLPVLRTIVDRAKQLAPADGRVQNLVDWVSNAEETHGVLRFG